MDHFPLFRRHRAKLRSYSVLDLKCEYEKQKQKIVYYPSLCVLPRRPCLFSSARILYISSPPFSTYFVDRPWRTLSYTRTDAVTFARRSWNPLRTSKFENSISDERDDCRLAYSLKIIIIIIEVVDIYETRHWYVNLANVGAHVRALPGK